MEIICPRWRRADPFFRSRQNYGPRRACRNSRPEFSPRDTLEVSSLSVTARYTLASRNFADLALLSERKIHQFGIANIPCSPQIQHGTLGLRRLPDFLVGTVRIVAYESGPPFTTICGRVHAVDVKHKRVIVLPARYWGEENGSIQPSWFQ